MKTSWHYGAQKDGGVKAEIQAVTHQMFESDSIDAMLHPKAHTSLKLDDEWLTQW